MKIVIALGHSPQPFEYVTYDDLPTPRDPERLGKELALFLYSNSVGGFWRGLREVAQEIETMTSHCSEKAMRRHFLGDPQQSDEEEAVFE